MPCTPAAITAGATYLLETADVAAAIDAFNAASAGSGAIEATGALGGITGWLLAVSWQLLPLTAIVIVLDFALRRAGPVVRSALWWIVLAKLIVPPGLASPLSIAQIWPVDGVSAIVTDRAAAPEARSDRSGETERRFGLAIWRDLILVRGTREQAEAVRDDLGLPGKSNRASGAAMLLLSIWAVGVVAAAVLACWRYRRVRAACLNGAQSLTDAASDDRDAVAVTSAAAAVVAASAAARRLGLSTLPPIFVAAHDARTAGLPAVIGFFSPCIVLPRPLLERPRGEIEHVLLHELAHVRRHDPLTSLVCLVAQIVFWFHPAVWYARRRLATLREMACDRTVARVLGDDTRAYRRTLILLARSAALATTTAASAAATVSAAKGAASASSRFASGPGALGLFQRQSELVTRLDALARPVSMRRATEYAASAALAAAILVSCVPLAPAPSPQEVSIDVPPLDQLPGSLQKRYAVMRAMALSEQAQPPRPSR